MPFDFPAWQRDKWTDLPQDPLIAPQAGAGPGDAIGDPQVLTPGEFDDRWHLFCHYWKFFRFDSEDGIHWDRVYDYLWKIGPTFLSHDGRQWIIYCSQHVPEEGIVTVNARTSADLVHWGEPVELLRPEQDWEKEGRRTQVRNPSVVALPDGRWRLYYCGGTVWLDDCGYEEPKYIGVAESEGPLGPFEKRRTPVLGPDPDKPWRNFGAGAAKVFDYDGQYLALVNGIYRDDAGRSRSAIDVLMSEDGFAWEDAPYNPIIEPSGEGWKKAIVYQLDLRFFRGRLWLYYNARDDWRGGREWIGCSTLEWSGPVPRKPWRLTSQ
jgi:hypothetical protein